MLDQGVQVLHGMALAGAIQLAQDGTRQMKQMCPKDTGALAASIVGTVEDGGNQIKVKWTAGNDQVDYAIYQEIGTSTQPAQPYMRPYFLPLFDMTKLASKLRQNRSTASFGE